MRPLFGCVLAGGESRRMGAPKALLEVDGRSFLERTVELLSAVTSQVFISAGPAHREAPTAGARYPVLYDVVAGGGPLSGIAAALGARRNVAWLFVAVDMPLLTRAALLQLVGAREQAGRDTPRRQVTAFRSPRTGGPEPLCSIWEPDTLPVVLDCMNRGERSVTRCLGKLSVQLADPVDERTLWNANTPADLKALRDHAVRLAAHPYVLGSSYTLEPRRSA